MKPVTYKAFDIDELKKAFHFAKNLLEKSREYAKFLGVYVTITLGKSNRSIEQNSYMWAVVYAMIADEMGLTQDEVHQIYTVKFLKKPPAFYLFVFNSMYNFIPIIWQHLT